MLTRVTLQNYRSFRDETVELDPLTVIVGKNGTGKSNFIDALLFVRDALRFGLGEAIKRRQGLWAIGWRGAGSANVRLALGCRLDLAGQVVDYAVELGHDDLKPMVESESLAVAGRAVLNGGLGPERGGAARGDRLRLPLLDAPDEAADASGFLTGIWKMSDNPRAVINKSGSAWSRSLDEDLTNAGGAIAAIRADAPRYEELKSTLCAALGFELDLVPDETDKRRVMFGTRRPGSEFDPTVDASTESDGTLWLAAVCTALYQLDLPPLMIIDEPERYCHPGAMAVLADEFVNASEQMQVIITTHSSELISLLPVESLRVVEWEDGQTRVGPISEEQLATVQNDLFKAGELVHMDGSLRRQVGQPTA